MVLSQPVFINNFITYILVINIHRATEYFGERYAGDYYYYFTDTYIS